MPCPCPCPKITLQFIVTANDIASKSTRGHGDLADQMRRASTSILLNLAEGAGEYTGREKARFYRMSKRSATECAAIVDVFHCLSLIGDAERGTAREALLRIVSMLIRLVQSAEERSHAIA